MIVNNTSEHKAVLSNVADTGEFKIKTSSRAFQILSSGLYANKIRAIIRELSCNAIDSHVAAGKLDTPFEIHLPNSLDPYFSIRDFGTGLNRDQVNNIYTTYFESTKTNSNDYIGALGLGSKSPFSYTNNFTVTAIKDGKKGIYSAYLNEQGVPAIALMAELDSDEPAGVEIKFPVDDRYDFQKFEFETRAVFEFFAQRPKVTGSANFKFSEPEYKTKDIIPGVHQLAHNVHNSIAVMGNIAYPIDISNKEVHFGDLASLLGCSLVMHFNIGELDFQASREGLSYDAATIAAIKAKLEQVRNNLASRIKQEIDAISEPWDRYIELETRTQTHLWAAAAVQLIKADYKDKFENNWKMHHSVKSVGCSLLDIKSKFNIDVRAFNTSSYSSTSAIRRYHFSQEWDSSRSVCFEHMKISPSTKIHFVINDVNNSIFERAKYHYREKVRTDTKCRGLAVFVLSAADRSKKMDLDAFFKFFDCPPDRQKFNASKLVQRPKAASTAVSTKAISVLKLVCKSGYSEEYVWRPSASKVAEMDNSKTYYYLPLVGSSFTSRFGYKNPSRLICDLNNSGIKKLQNIEVYGVRKSDIKEVEKNANWIELELYVEQVVGSLKQDDFISQAARQVCVPSILGRIARSNFLPNDHKICQLVKVLNDAASKNPTEYDQHAQHRILSRFNSNVPALIKDQQAVFEKQLEEISARYPMIDHVYRSVGDQELVDYINLVDLKKTK